ACIAHKSLEICERCWLRRRNSPPTPENSAAFWREEFKNSFFRFTCFKTGSKQTHKSKSQELRNGTAVFRSVDNPLRRRTRFCGPVSCPRNTCYFGDRTLERGPEDRC